MKLDEKEKVRDSAELVSEWNKRITSATNLEKSWRESADNAVQVYESSLSEKGNSNGVQAVYNILYANTQILAPAIYSNPPKPAIKRRFDDPDELGRKASQVANRVVSYLINPDNPNYSNVDQIMKYVVTSGLVSGRGASRVKYDAEISENGEVSNLDYEIVCGETIKYNRFLHSYAQEWSQVDWIAICHYKTKEDVKKLLNKDNLHILDQINFSYAEEAMKSEFSNIKGIESDVKLAKLWEIWDKQEKQVIIIACGYEDAPISIKDDPYGLVGFFPIPEPIGFYQRVSGLTPQLLYSAYRTQAEELNRISKRIIKITDALKVRGFYDSNIERLGDLATADDNVLLAADNILRLEGKSLDNVIWLMPLSDLVNVLNQLYLNRQQIKSVIFELTGIADIMRGSTSASETLGAQNLKSQWGTMRLKDMQKEAARYARDLIRLMCELAFTKLEQETIIQITDMQIPTNEDRMNMQEQSKQLQTQLVNLPQQLMIEAQQSGQQIDPEQMQSQIDQASQEIQAQLQQLNEQIHESTWEEVLDFLKNDLIRSYRIDIETNSTIEVDAVEDKQDVAEFMNSFSQFLNGVSPMVQEGLLSFDVAKSLMMAIVRKYKFGEEVEELLMKMTAPQPQQDPDEESNNKKLQLEMQKLQIEIAAKQENTKIDKQIAETNLSIQQATLQSKLHEDELAKERADYEHNAKLVQMANESDLQNKKFNLDLQKLANQREVMDRQHMVNLTKYQMENINRE